jgi:hypothetical protein
MANVSGFNSSLFTSGVSSIGTAASDLFAGLYTAPAEQAAAQAQVAMAKASASADILQSQGDILEGQTYGQAATLAELNAQYTQESTAIQEAQAQRQTYMAIGGATAAAGGSGSSGGGSAGAILRNSAQQGALNAAVIQQQGLITQAGYNEQAASYYMMQQAAGVAAQAQTVAAGGETTAAQEYQTEANLFGESSTADYVSSALSGVAGVAEIAGAFMLSRRSGERRHQSGRQAR